MPSSQAMRQRRCGMEEGDGGIVRRGRDSPILQARGGGCGFVLAREFGPHLTDEIGQMRGTPTITSWQMSLG